MQDMRGLNGRTAPKMPFWWFILQCVILAFGLGIFIVSCYALSIVGGGGPHAFLLFDALMIFIVVGGFIAIERFLADWYFRLAFIISYALLIIFLLSAWAWGASIAADFLSNTCYGSWGCFGPSDEFKRFGQAMAAAAALGAITWVLLIVSLVFYVMAAVKDGSDAPPVAAPGHATGAAHATPSDAEMGAVKTEQPATSEPVSAVSPQQQYEHPQQPTYQPRPSEPSYQTSPYTQPAEMPSPENYQPQQHQGPQNP